MNSTSVVLLGLLAGTFGAGLAQAQPSVVVPSSGRLQEALVLQDSIRRTEQGHARVQREHGGSLDVWALNALQGVSTLEQMDLYLIRASRERAFRDSRSNLAMPSPSFEPVTSTPPPGTAASVPGATATEVDEVEPNSSAGGHEELYRLNQRLARYEESIAGALEAGRPPEAVLIDERLDLLNRRNELAQKLGVPTTESSPLSAVPERIRNLTGEVEAWTKLLRGSAPLDRERAERMRNAAMRELDGFTAHSSR